MRKLKYSNLALLLTGIFKTKKIKYKFYNIITSSK
jgi:hypothetical protein